MASVESRIVSIDFDNKSFGSKIGDTLKGLSKLKESLSFKGAGNGLKNVAAETNKFNMGGMASAVEGVSGKFLALSTIAITALSNITSRALDAGLSVAKSFTIQPITDGFNEYELKMGAIQTIMAGSGESLKTVNGYLEELNTYSDQTIYSFADMTQNIGKFTNAGVSLKDSVASIKGVANVAALSGANAQQASAAMYNFAQALSSGSVKLIDWKSIENAGLATEGFKTQLLDSAVAAGTLTGGVDGMYTTLEGTPVTATKGFNEALSEQFLTTEVLTSTLKKYSDETTEIGAAATAAASDVKTFSQLMDTLKEAAGSGWATSSELIFGDFNEAKALFTELSDALGGLIGDSAASRNAILTQWNNFGGRTTLIDSFRSSFQSLAKIVQFAQDAFRNLFPKKTSVDLLNLTNGFERFSQALGRFVARNESKIRLIFDGIFSVMKIGVAVVKGIFSVFSTLFGLFAGGGSSALLTFGSKLGSFLSKIREFLVDGGKIQGFFDAISGGLTKLVGAFKGLSIEPLIRIKDALVGMVTGLDFGSLTKAFGTLKDAIFGLFGGIDVGPSISKFEEFGRKIETFIKKIDLQPAIDAVAKFINKIVQYFSGLSFDKPKQIFKDLKESIVGLFGGGGEEDVAEGGNSIKRMVGDVSENAEKATSAFDKFKSVLSSVGNFLSRIGSEVKSAIQPIKDAFTGVFDGASESFTFENVAAVFSGAALGTIVASIAGVFNSIRKMFKSAGGIMDSLAEGMQAVTGSLEAFQTNLKAQAILAIAKAMLVLAVALVILSFADLVKVGIGMGILTAGLAALVVGMKQLSEITEGAMTTAKVLALSFGLIAIATAIAILALAAKLMQGSNFEEMAAGLGVVITLLVGLGGAVKLMGDPAHLGKAGLGILFISLGLLVLSAAMKIMGSLEWEEIHRGLAGLAGGLAGLVIAVNLIPAKTTAKAGAAMLLLSIGMLFMAKAVEKMGALDLDTIGRGVLGLGGVLIALGVAMRLAGDKKSLKGAASMGLATFALHKLADVLEIFGRLPFDVLKQGMIAIGLILIGLAAALVVMSFTLQGAAALVIAAGALFILAEVMEKLAAMSWSEILKSLGALALVLAAIGVAAVLFAVAAVLMAPMVPLMVALGVAVLLLGAGMVLFGVGALIFAAALTLIVATGAAGIALLVKLFDLMIEKLPALGSAIGAAFAAFLRSFIEGTPEILAALTTMFNSIMDTIVKTIPKIVIILGLMIDAFIVFMSEQAPAMIAAGIELLKAFLQGIADSIAEITLLGVDIMIALAEAIRSRMFDIVLTAVELMTDFLDQLADQLPDVVTAGINVLVELIKGISKNINDVATAAGELMTSFLDEIDEQIPNVITAGANVVISIVNSIGDNLFRIFIAGVEMITKFISAIDDNVLRVVGAGADMIIDLVNGLADMVDEKAPELKTAFKRLGWAIIRGITGGIGEKAEEAYSKAREVADTILSILSGKWLINSPSKATMKLAASLGEGIALGLDQDKLAAPAAERMAVNVLDTMKDALSHIPDTLEGFDEFNPTITPVLDLTGVQRDAKSLNGFMGMSSIGGRVSFDQASGIAQANELARAQQGTSETISSPTEVRFEQNNYSPKALSSNDIYRQTRSQIAVAKLELSIP